jgi:hypothetical protein
MKTIPFKLLLAGCLLISTGVYAQQENLDTNAFNEIRKAELENSHVAELAHYLTDVAGPRLTNSPGFNRAGKWAVETMKKWGMVNAAMEPWGEFGKQWELEDFSMSMTLPYRQPLRAYAEPWSSSTNGTVHGEVVIMERMRMLDTAYILSHMADFKGKFILLPGAPLNTESNFKPSATRLADTALANLQETYMIPKATLDIYRGYFKILRKVTKLLKTSGALGMIMSEEEDSNGTVVVQANTGFRLTDPEGIPSADIAIEDAQKIKRLLASGQHVELALSITAKSSTADTKGYNVVAEIPGTDPTLKSQLVMLGGHLDSWQAATGATDNAAGCIVMMEAVRLLDSLHLKPKRTIRIALWSGEEQGLLGSYFYAKNHFMDGKTFTLKPEQSKVSVYFNLDNGTGKIRGIYTQNNKAVIPIFEKWFAPLHDIGAATVTEKNTGSTDHLSFDWAGIPGFEFVQDPIDYETRTHHSNLDDYDHLQMDDLKQASIIVASFVYQASIRADMLPRKPLVKETFAWDGF